MTLVTQGVALLFAQAGRAFDEIDLLILVAVLQLVIVGAARTGEVQQLLGAAGALALRASDFSLLVVGLGRPGRSYIDGSG